jgi:hypothetical protein
MGVFFAAGLDAGFVALARLDLSGDFFCVARAGAFFAPALVPAPRFFVALPATGSPLRHKKAAC